MIWNPTGQEDKKNQSQFLLEFTTLPHHSK